MSYAARTVSLSVSTALWAALLVGLAAVGPQVVTFIPREPPNLTGVELLDPLPPPEPKPTAAERIPRGAEPVVTPLVATPELIATPDPVASHVARDPGARAGHTPGVAAAADGARARAVLSAAGDRA